MLTSTNFYNPYPGLVILSARGEVKFSYPDLGTDESEEKLPAFRQALLVVEGQPVLFKEEHLAKESAHPDNIIRAEKPELVTPEKEIAIGDDRRRLDMVIAEIKKMAPSSLVEIGCSQGVISLRAARSTGADVTGVDIRPEAIETANDLLKTDYKDVGDHCRFMLWDDFQSRAASYNCVSLLEVLEHLTTNDQRQLIESALTVLQPDGTLFASVPNRFPRTEYEENSRKRWNAPAHVSFFSLTTFTNLMKEYFESVESVALPGDGIDDGIWLHLVCRGKK